MARRSRVEKISGRLPAILPFFRVSGGKFGVFDHYPFGSGDRAPTLDLLEAALKRGNVKVFYDCDVDKIDFAKNSGGSKVGALETESNPNAVNLFEKSGKVLGTYDLVFDSMGWNSSLRKHRVTDTSSVKYSGQVSIHGAIMNPEKSAPKELMNLIEDFGSVVLSSKKHIFLQRYGGGENDNRTSYWHFVTRTDKNSIYNEIGIKKPSSRSESLMTGTDLHKVKRFLHDDLKDADFGVYAHQAIDCLDRVTVRPEVVSSGETELKPSNLPLVCLGDSQANCGLGGGGILAMQDSLELAELVVDEYSKIGSFNDETGEFYMEKFLPIERKMLDRRNEFITEKRKRGFGSWVDFRKSWYEIVSKFVIEPEGSILLPVKRVLITGAFRSVVAVFNTFYKIEKQIYGGIGSDAKSKVYPGVKKALDKQKKKIVETV